MLALSFPRYGHAAVVFIAVAPLLVALSGWRGRPGHCPGIPARRAFALGVLAGAVHYAGTVYWAGATVHTYGGLSWPVAVIVTGLLVLYMSLFVGLASAAIAALVQRFGLRGLWLAPAAWVAAEYARAHLFGGFPWIPVGSAVVTLLPVAQLASLVGVFGLSAFLVALNVAVVVAAVGEPRSRLAAGVAGVIALATVSVWGGARLAASPLAREGQALTVALVQGNVPQEEKWDPARAPAIVERYLTMTRDAAARGADLVVWPESATPFFFDEDPAGASQIRSVVRDVGVPLLFGTDEVLRGSPPRYYNSAFMLDVAGATAAVYRKIHLVPFGEYVPFKRLLFFVAPLVEAVADFSPGTTVTMLPVAGHMASTAICYEIVYPHLIRRGVLAGAEMLTTITNDAWYGSTSAPHQHFEQAAMRAIENGRYLARAANTGISGVIDPYGRVVARSGLFETTVVMGEVRPIRALTVYARIGDLVAELSVLLTLVALGAALWRRPW
ncbi:MAG: apolipoprotein N-acyltransferase [Acidobacteriota bacterium]